MSEENEYYLKMATLFLAAFIVFLAFIAFLAVYAKPEKAVDKRSKSALTGGFSQQDWPMSATVRAVFLCPNSDFPCIGVADGNMTAAQAVNTVAGFQSCPREPRGRACLALKSERLDMKTITVAVSRDDAAAFAGVCKQDGLRVSEGMTRLIRWSIAQNSLCPMAEGNDYLMEQSDRAIQILMDAMNKVNGIEPLKGGAA